ncbi:MAG TPA: HAD family hydrolase [Opitutaceae bacterium]|nr:HAD family hydrolase [Opitutaceae bacterium]
MNPQRCIGFDADDTLWHNENIFERVHARFYELLARHRDAAGVKRALDAAERRNLELYGYGIKGFMLSSIETAIELAEGKLSPREVREILALGREMLEHPVELLDGAREVLEVLAPDFRLVLITKGDLRDQERKLSKSGLADLFRAVEIVSEKDAGTYGRIFERHGIEPAGFLMVGNSIKSDILPVLELGGCAVHVPYRITWGLEHAEPPPNDDGRFFQAQSLRDLPEIVRKWP